MELHPSVSAVLFNRGLFEGWRGEIERSADRLYG